MIELFGYGSFMKIAETVVLLSRGAFAQSAEWKAIRDTIHSAITQAEWPVGSGSFTIHPESGKKILYVNSAFTTHILGWTPQESAPLLNYLYQHAARPEFQYRFSWRDGSIAFWDNRSTWHYAVNDYHGARRLMHRITIQGGPLA